MDSGGGGGGGVVLSPTKKDLKLGSGLVELKGLYLPADLANGIGDGAVSGLWLALKCVS